MGGAAGPTDVSLRPPDALKAACIFFRETDGCVPGLATCQGRGAPLGTLQGSRIPVPGPLRVVGRGLDVLSVRGVLARGSVRPCGRGLGALPVRGVLARGSVGPCGRGLGALLIRGVLARGSTRPRGRGLALTVFYDACKYQ